MSTTLLAYCLTIALALLCAAMAVAAYRVVRGPRAQDRVLGLDRLYLNATLLMMVFGIRQGTDLYFEAAFIIALVGAVSTAALSKFLLRGEVIE